MNYLMALSISTGILCGLWIEVSSIFGLIGAAGFAGCTTFFAAGGKLEGLKSALATNLIGIFWAMMIIGLTWLFPTPHTLAAATVIITFFMCIQSTISYFKFIPGTFIGGFCTFFSNGDWIGVAIAIIIGSFLGFACEKSGELIYQYTNQKANNEGEFYDL